MATGYLKNGLCYDSLSTATDAYYSAFVPSVVSGATSYTLQYNNVSGVWKAMQYSINATGVYTLRSTSNAPSLTFPTCDTTQQFFDGLTIGWLIAGAMALAWGARLIRSKVR